MEDCNICMTLQSKDKFFKASVCGHSLCCDCFKKLHKNECPFCRQKYTNDEIILRNPNNSSIQYNPPYYSQINGLNLRMDIYNDDFSIQVPYSRVRRSMRRNRRRNLTFEEIKERRKRVKKRMKLKWRRKNGRLAKYNLVH